MPTRISKRTRASAFSTAPLISPPGPLILGAPSSTSTAASGVKGTPATSHSTLGRISPLVTSPLSER